MDDHGFSSEGFRKYNDFFISDKGLGFHYNPYEIASYAYGPREFILPYENIIDIINPNGVLPRIVQVNKKQ